MSYTPHTDADRRRILDALGLRSVEDLFSDIPEDLRYPVMELPGPLSEIELREKLNRLASENPDAESRLHFLGAGAYNHFIPSVVDYLSSRGEFATAYTPYQPEASQGTLMALFEYQSMLSSLLGMDVVNASHYDGSTALAEALLLSVRQAREKRKKIVVSPAVHPEYLHVSATYLQFLDLDFAGLDQSTGGAFGERLDLDPGKSSRQGEKQGYSYPLYPDPEKALSTRPSELLDLVDEETACLVLSYPDFFGNLYDLQGIAERVHEKGALLVVHTDPIALGLFKSPGAWGADIVTAEGQPLGLPLSYGGPYLGIFAVRRDLVRKMPGRLAGETVDSEGKRGFVLTLNTREQHIRREKATSNICTNQGLMALRAAIYLGALGPRGLKQVAELCYHRARYAAERIANIPGFSLLNPAAVHSGGSGTASKQGQAAESTAKGDRRAENYSEEDQAFTEGQAFADDLKNSTFFREFVVRTPLPAADLVDKLGEDKIVPGLPLSRYYADAENLLLCCVTEVNDKKQIDTLVEALGRAARELGCPEEEK